MASSSVSQEDADLESLMQSTPTCTRARFRVRNSARVPASRNNSSSSFNMGTAMGTDPQNENAADAAGVVSSAIPDHESSPKPRAAKDKRCPPRPAQTTKAKMQRRKLREKRRSTGVVHLLSTESTGGSTEGEEDPELDDAVTRRNTELNESSVGTTTGTGTVPHHQHERRTNKSPSDLDADEEDNDYDSTVNQSDSALSLATHAAITLDSLTTHDSHPHSHHIRQRPETPCTQKTEELLDRAREENARLLDLLKDRDDRISALEARILSMTMELSELSSTNQDLKEQNSVLLNALANSTSK